MVNKCAECGGINLKKHKSGELVCMNCGLVVEETIKRENIEFKVIPQDKISVIDAPKEKVLRALQRIDEENESEHSIRLFGGIFGYALFDKELSLEASSALTQHVRENYIKNKNFDKFTINQLGVVIYSMGRIAHHQGCGFSDESLEYAREIVRTIRKRI